MTRLIIFVSIFFLLLATRANAQPTPTSCRVYCPDGSSYLVDCNSSVDPCSRNNPTPPRPPKEPTQKQLKKEKAWDLNHQGILANEKGRNCWDKRDWECAITYFQQAIDYYQQAMNIDKDKIYKENLDRNQYHLKRAFCFKYNEQGNNLYKQAKYSDAENSFRMSLQYDPDYAIAHSNLGLALEMQGKYDAAIEEYKKALKIDASTNNIAQHLERVKAKIEEQKKTDNKTVSLKLNEEANKLYSGEKYKEAEQLYQKAIALNPSDPVLYSNLADAQSKQGKFKDAELTYRKAIEADPSNIDYKIRAGNAIFDQGRLSDARNYYQELVASNPGIATLYFNLGYIQAQGGDYKDAEKNYRKSIELYSNDVNYYYNLGLLLEKQGRYSEAAKEYQSAMKVHPGDKTVQASIDKLVKEGKMSITEVTPGSIKDPLSQLVSSQIQGFDVVIDGKGKYFVELSPLVADGSTKYVEKVPEKLAKTEQFQLLLKEERKIRDEFAGLQKKLDETKKKKEEATGNKSDLEMEIVKLKEDMTKKENEFNMNRFKQTEAVRNFHEDFEEAPGKKDDKSKNQQ